MNKQNVGNFLLPLVATRQVRQGGYLHKNIFDVQHLHQSKGRKYFVFYYPLSNDHVHIMSGVSCGYYRQRENFTKIFKFCWNIP